MTDPGTDLFPRAFTTAMVYLLGFVVGAIGDVINSVVLAMSGALILFAVTALYGKTAC